MKERENREELDTCKRPSPSRCLSIDIFVLLYTAFTGVSSGSAESGPRPNQTVQGPSFPLARSRQDRIS